MKKRENEEKETGKQEMGKKRMEKKGMTRIAVLLAAVLLIVGMACLCAGCGADSGSSDVQQSTKQQIERTMPTTDPENVEAPDRDGVYDSKDDVALYLYVYGELPRNYITKHEAQALGWNGGSLERYAPGKCIGGGSFGNYERRLPEGKYRECDINTLGAKSRGPERLVYSDEAIYYTGDHYETFEQLYDKHGKL